MVILIVLTYGKSCLDCVMFLLAAGLGKEAMIGYTALHGFIPAEAGVV